MEPLNCLRAISPNSAPQKAGTEPECNAAVVWLLYILFANLQAASASARNLLPMVIARASAALPSRARRYTPAAIAAQRNSENTTKKSSSGTPARPVRRQ